MRRFRTRLSTPFLPLALLVALSLPLGAHAGGRATVRSAQFSMQALPGEDAWEKLQAAFEEGQKPSLEDLAGWKAGVFVESRDRTRLRPAILVSEQVDRQRGPLFPPALVSMLFPDSSLDPGGELSPETRGPIQETFRRLAPRSTDVSEQDDKLSFETFLEPFTSSERQVTYQVRKLGDLLVLKIPSYEQIYYKDFPFGLPQDRSIYAYFYQDVTPESSASSS